VVSATGADKKHAGGRLRWVLPTDDGVVVRDDVPPATIVEAVRHVLAGSATTAPTARRGGAA
jgi:hypothetical protein